MISRKAILIYKDITATEVTESVPLLPDVRGAKGHFTIRNNNYAIPIIINGIKVGRKVLEEGKDYFIGDRKIEPGQFTWISFYIDNRVKNIAEKGKRVNILYGSYQLPEVLFDEEVY